MSEILKELSLMAANHKLVPFLGSGCSVPQLKYDWDSIITALAIEVDTKETDHLLVAQKYVDCFSKQQLCDFLKQRFYIEDFSDKLGYAHLAIMSLGTGVIYTTNQDNVMEKCFEKYGRKFKLIKSIEDFSNSKPGDRLYIKYHGDLSLPESVVFSQQDYEKRMQDTDHFLNIRLKSDLLAKQLFFIGYSLRDKNIHEILTEIQNVFKGKMPKSYMLVYEHSKEIEERCNQFGINLINPLIEFPECKTNQEAFEKFLQEFVTQTMLQKHEKQINDIFRPLVPATERVVSPLEIESLDRIVDRDEFKDACSKFRAIMDQSLIPKDLESEVLNIFRKLIVKCSNEEESEALKSAAFNLYISDKKLRVELVILLMTTANVREHDKDIFNRLHIHVNGVPEDIYIYAVAFATERLLSWGRKITDSFRVHVTSWVERSLDFEELDEDTQKFIKGYLDKAWEGPTIYEHPIKRQQRLKKTGFPRLGRNNSSDQILSRMMESLPKSFNKPFED